MTARAAWLHDHGEPAGEAANMAKYSAAEAALAAVDAAIQTHGGNGLAVDYGRSIEFLPDDPGSPSTDYLAGSVDRPVDRG
jgi:alkylation response protein AidB-like acyl-CoA dehydrogenase